MSESSNERVALVTGGAVRVGREISTALARAGFRLAVNYHDSGEDAHALVDELAVDGMEARCFQADITDRPSAEGMLEQVFASFGGVDLLVNNAAVFERCGFLDLDEATWRRHLALNLEAPFWLSQMVAEAMLAGDGGRIVNICGTVGIEPLGDYVPYCVAKSGLDTLTRCLAAALAPRIQVNGVAPGAILFPEGTRDEDRRAVLERIPAGRVGSPADVAAAVVFLADAPEYITGTILPVDGGASLVTG